jgi:hypothetical protein
MELFVKQTRSPRSENASLMAKDDIAKRLSAATFRNLDVIRNFVAKRLAT